MISKASGPDYAPSLSQVVGGLTCSNTYAKMFKNLELYHVNYDDVNNSEKFKHITKLTFIVSFLYLAKYLQTVESEHVLMIVILFRVFTLFYS